MVYLHFNFYKRWSKIKNTRDKLLIKKFNLKVKFDIYNNLIFISLNLKSYKNSNKTLEFK